MTDKGVTIERSPSGLGIGVFSPHLGGGGSTTWEPHQSTIITKLAQTPTTRIHTNETFEIDRRIRKTDEKNNVNRSCGCGGWARAVQLEHDLTELSLTHQNLLVGLHLQVDSLKQKNRDLTFQLLMGPSAAQVKPDFPFSPESDEASSPKNELAKKIEPNNKRENKSARTADTSPITITSTAPVTSSDASTTKVPLKVQSPPATLVNGDIVVRRPLPGRSVRGDPRLVRSLDLELLEYEADHTRGLLEEERAKNKYLTSLVEDLKRSSERDSGTTFPAIASARPEQQQHEQPQQHEQQRGRGRYFGRGRTRNRQQQQPQQQQQRQETSEAEPSLHLAKGSGRPPPPREESRGRRDPVRTPTSPRDSSQGTRGSRHGRDGSVGATSSSQTEIKRGASGQEQEPRPETRTKGRGRAHRRGGRGRPRKEKHNTPSEQLESEQ